MTALSNMQIGLTVVLGVLLVMLIVLLFFSCFRKESEPKFQKGEAKSIVTETPAMQIVTDPNAVNMTQPNPVQ